MDLHRLYGLDLLDFFRGTHSWRKLALLVEHLPGSSATVEAQLDDPEYAEWVASLSDGPPRGPKVSEWTPDVAMLTNIYDRLGELIGAVIAGAGGKPPQNRPLPRPKTEVDRFKERAARARHQSLVDEVHAAQQRWVASRNTRRR